MVGVASGVPRDENSSFGKGLEACRRILGDRDRCRLHGWRRVSCYSRRQVVVAREF
jgi:hypothetical protein